MKFLMKIFGATEEDLALLESGYVHQTLPRDLQPVMKHRQLAIHRMLIDQTNKDINIKPAYTHACTQIPRREIASTPVEGSNKLNFKRYLYLGG